MADNDSKRYYWLKLQKDFFKRHDIRIVENMPNGKDYILFYLKMLCESTSHNGELRFSETIPYNEEMLSTITNTNVDIVRQAINIFRELEMIDVLDNGTLFMTEIHKMLGSETGQTIRKREAKLLSGKVPVKNTLEIELDKDIDIEIEIDNKKNIKHKYGEYKNVLLSDEQLEKLKNEFTDWEERIERVSSYCASTGKSYKDYLATIRNWSKKDKQKERGNVPNYDKERNSFEEFVNAHRNEEL